MFHGAQGILNVWSRTHAFEEYGWPEKRLRHRQTVGRRPVGRNNA